MDRMRMSIAGLCCIVVLSILPNAVWAASVVQVSSVSGEPGGSVEVKVNASDLTDAAAGDLVVRYDASALSVVGTNVLEGGSAVGLTSRGINSTTTGQVKAGFFTADPPPSGGGDLFAIEFLIGLGATGELALRLEVVDDAFFDLGDNAIGVTTQDGSIRVVALSLPPEADFTTSTSSGEAPLSVSFTDRSTGEITSRSWDFGDGSTGTGKVPKHTYDRAGTFTATLMVTGSGGTASRSMEIVVVEPDEPDEPDELTPSEGDGTLVLDFDLASGDQGGRQLSNVQPGQEIVLQVVLNEEIEGFKQVEAVIQFDPTKMSPKSAKGVGINAGGITLSPSVEGDQVTVGSAILFGAGASGKGEVLEITFVLANDFKGPTGLTFKFLSIGPSINDRQVFSPGARVVVGGESSGIPGDFDGSGKVDFSDFFIFADGFGGTDPAYDLDGSGKVDFSDFFIFADNFGKEALGKLLVLAREYLGLPGDLNLEQNYPNPFNHSTTISYQMSESGWVRLDVFDVAGQRVRSLVDHSQPAGYYQIHWDGTSDDGFGVSSGMYFIQLQQEDLRFVKKTLLMK
jgi:PKD repeat protein